MALSRDARWFVSNTLASWRQMESPGRRPSITCREPWPDGATISSTARLRGRAPDAIARVPRRRGHRVREAPRKPPRRRARVASGMRRVRCRPRGSSALVCLMMGVLAVTIRHRRRRRGRRWAPVTPAPEGGSDAAEVSSDAWSPEDHDGAAALRIGRTLAANGDRLGAERAFRRAEEHGDPRPRLSSACC